MFQIEGNQANRMDIYKYADENELQQLLYLNPEMIYSLDHLDLGNAETAIACREFSVGIGNIDVLFITSNADILLIETKLIKNPEASRTVIAQVIDYVKNLACMDVDLFMEGINKAKNKSVDNEICNDSRFLSYLETNLRTGNINILVAGDDINPNLIGMVSSIQAAPHLAFTLYLVKLFTFKNNQSKFILPLTISKTLEIERSVIKISIDHENKNHTIESEVPEKNGKGSKPVLTWEQYIENISDIEKRKIIKEFRKGWLEIDRAGLSMGTVGFSAGVYINGKRIPLQFIYDGYLDMLSDKYRKSYSVPDEIYKYYMNCISKLPHIYDSILVSNKVRVNYDDITVSELREILNAALNTARKYKAEAEKDMD